MGHTRRTRPYRQMDNVEIGQDTPQAVDLRVVAVDLGDNEEDAAQEDGGTETRHQRIRLNVSLFEAIKAADVVKHSMREIVELVNEGLNGLGVDAAVFDGLEQRERHFECLL